MNTDTFEQNTFVFERDEISRLLRRDIIAKPLARLAQNAFKKFSKTTQTSSEVLTVTELSNCKNGAKDRVYIEDRGASQHLKITDNSDGDELVIIEISFRPTGKFSLNSDPIEISIDCTGIGFEPPETSAQVEKILREIAHIIDNLRGGMDCDGTYREFITWAELKPLAQNKIDPRIHARIKSSRFSDRHFPEP